MQLADATEPAVAAPQRVAVGGWGGRSRVPVSLVHAVGVEQLRSTLATVAEGGVIARGLGRSYGDAAQLDGGLVVEMTRMRAVQFDRAHGTVRAEAGVTIGQLLETVLPAGWVLPVVPGTQHVTVGGAIAADIHGKNHARAGSFGTHVRSLGLLTATGELLELGSDRDRAPFDATTGGMGLTGVIVWAELQLTRVPGPALSIDSDQAHSLNDVLALLDAPGGQYRVAWLDLLGATPARGVVTRGEHCAGTAAAPTVNPRLTVPSGWPGGVLNAAVARAYNEYRFRRARGHGHGRRESFARHMFPLDAVNAWPRLYGREGLIQYQLAVPRAAEDALEDVVLGLRRSRVPCYLAVLKDFGVARDAPLSFPMPGWTLAMDLPGAAPGLSELLAHFDQLVAGAGGRVYLAKDSSVRPDALAAMYPRLAEWRALRDSVDPERRWQSDLGRRTGLVA